MAASRRLRSVVLGVAVGMMLAVGAETPALAVTPWSVGVGASTGTAASGTLGTSSITVQCTSSTSNGVTASWTPVARASNYTVLYSTSGSGGTYSAYTTTTSTSMTGTIPTAGTYYFKIQTNLGTSWRTTSTFAGPVTIATSPSASCSG